MFICITSYCNALLDALFIVLYIYIFLFFIIIYLYIVFYTGPYVWKPLL